MAIMVRTVGGELIITKWEFKPAKNVEIRTRGKDEGDIIIKRNTLKEITKKVEENVPFEQIKQEINMSIIEEKARWKV
jgi:hypothetical protein